MNEDDFYTKRKSNKFTIKLYKFNKKQSSSNEKLVKVQKVNYKKSPRKSSLYNKRSSKALRIYNVEKTQNHIEKDNKELLMIDKINNNNLTLNSSRKNAYEINEYNDLIEGDSYKNKQIYSNCGFTKEELIKEAEDFKILIRKSTLNSHSGSRKNTISINTRSSKNLDNSKKRNTKKEEQTNFSDIDQKRNNSKFLLDSNENDNYNNNKHESDININSNHDNEYNELKNITYDLDDLESLTGNNMNILPELHLSNLNKLDNELSLSPINNQKIDQRLFKNSQNTCEIDINGSNNIYDFKSNFIVNKSAKSNQKQFTENKIISIKTKIVKNENTFKKDKKNSASKNNINSKKSKDKKINLENLFLNSKDCKTFNYEDLMRTLVVSDSSRRNRDLIKHLKIEEILKMKVVKEDGNTTLTNEKRFPTSRLTIKNLSDQLFKLSNFVNLNKDLFNVNMNSKRVIEQDKNTLSITPTSPINSSRIDMDYNKEINSDIFTSLNKAEIYAKKKNLIFNEVIDKVSKVPLCVYCNDLYENAKICYKCHNIMCLECFQKNILKNGNCYICFNYISEKLLIDVSKEVDFFFDRTTLICPNKCCQIKFKLKDLKDHFKKCMFIDKPIYFNELICSIDFKDTFQNAEKIAISYFEYNEELKNKVEPIIKSVYSNKLLDFTRICYSNMANKEIDHKKYLDFSKNKLKINCLKKTDLINEKLMNENKIILDSENTKSPFIEKVEIDLCQNISPDIITSSRPNRLNLNLNTNLTHRETSTKFTSKNTNSKNKEDNISRKSSKSSKSTKSLYSFNSSKGSFDSASNNSYSSKIRKKKFKHLNHKSKLIYPNFYQEITFKSSNKFNQSVRKSSKFRLKKCATAVNESFESLDKELQKDTLLVKDPEYTLMKMDTILNFEIYSNLKIIKKESLLLRKIKESMEKMSKIANETNKKVINTLYSNK